MLMNMGKKMLDSDVVVRFSFPMNDTKLLKLFGEVMEYREKFHKYDPLQTVWSETTGIKRPS